MFKGCNSLESFPDISKFFNKNVFNLTAIGKYKQLEEIKLEKLGAFDIHIDVPAEQDITVSPDPDSIPGGTRFTAPEGFISYVWKVNGVVQTEATGNVFDLLHSTLPYGRTDVSLLVNDGTNYYSWQSQVYKPVN
jgi:hypothetical protein